MRKSPPCPFHRRPDFFGVTLLFLAFAGISFMGVRPAFAATPDQIDSSVKRAVAYLYAQQKPTGQWESSLTRTTTKHSWEDQQGDTFGGYTALCVFALLEAGEKPSDPRLVKAIDFLKKADVFGTYSIGLRCMVYAKLAQTPEIKKLLQDDVNRLLGGIIREGDALGMWDYESGLKKRVFKGDIDRSVSQFGVLGLWAGVQAGATVPPETWRLFDTVWRNGQCADGSWSYNLPASPSGGIVSMTAAGAATLLIVQDVLGSLAGTGGVTSPVGSDESINRALNFLSTKYEDVLNSGPYSMYGVERISTAGGFRYIGQVDWFTLAGNFLHKTQREDGSWTGGTPGATPLSETALGLLTLVHGRAPVLISKLNYNAVLEGVARDAPWHARPRDAGNLTRYVGNQLEQVFGWQIVSFAASSDELLESPILLITGSKEVVLSDKERAKLKGYVDGGGLIICSSEAMPRAGGSVGSDPFSQSIVYLAKQMYPERAFRDLPLNHPLYTDQQFKATRWTNKPPVWGLSNGVREMIFLLPQGDLGRAWNTNRPTVDAMKWELGADLCQYATSRMPRPARGRTHLVTPTYWTTPTTRPVSTDGRRPSSPSTQPIVAEPAPPDAAKVVLPADAKFLTVGRLMVGENWDPEPGAWARMTAILANNFRLFVDYKPVGATDKELADVKLLHWTGTTVVKLTPAQRTAISSFISKGGTLLIDAAGGSAAFADSAQAELNTLFSSSAKEFGALIAPDDPVFRIRDARIDKVTYRRYTSGRTTGSLDVPRLRGLDRAGRTVVYFSREDLTAGCVGQSTDGIMGYSPESATAIMRNIVLTAAKKK